MTALADLAEPTASGACFRLWRRGAVVALQLHGTVDDAGSDAWRAAAADELARARTRFIVFDAVDAVPMNSFVSRMKTVGFARASASQVERVLARGAPEARYAVIGRVLLHAVGLANVDHEEDPARFDEKVRAWLAAEGS